MLRHYLVAHIKLDYTYLTVDSFCIQIKGFEQGEIPRGASWLSGSVTLLRTSERSRVRSPAALNLLRRCAPRQGTLLTCAFSRPRSKWVPGRTVKACVFEQFRAPKVAAGLYAPRGVEMTLI